MAPLAICGDNRRAPPRSAVTTAARAAAICDAVHGWGNIGRKIGCGDVLLVGADQMVQVIVCCSVEDTLALLVREGTLQEARQWSSTWTLQSEAQFFVLDGNVFEQAALWGATIDVLI